MHDRAPVERIHIVFGIVLGVRRARIPVGERLEARPVKVEEILPTVLDPYEVPENMGKAMSKVIPLIQQERPELLKKLSGFNDLPPEVVLNKTIRAGFDCRFTT